MAIVQGIREKVHSPIYDSVRLRGEEQLHEVEKSGTLKFFVNVQNKTKLETNLTSASLLPHYNTFEARAMRVVISDLPPEFPDDAEKGPTVSGEDFAVTTEDEDAIDGSGRVEGVAAVAPAVGFTIASRVTAEIELTIGQAVALLREARKSDDGFAVLPADDDAVTLVADDGTVVVDQAVADAGGVVFLSEDDINGLLDELRDQQRRPLPEQIHSGNGGGTLIGKLIYNTVTTLYVGEKVMIQMPTWFFPGGAGPYSEQDHVTTHGSPSPLDTFRFAEPIFIDKQQNFRVEIEIPDADALKELQRIYGPFYLWVVLDGYMERGVQ